jgi:chromosomal replication initiation ATPase DnaA
MKIKELKLAVINYANLNNIIQVDELGNVTLSKTTDNSKEKFIQLSTLFMIVAEKSPRERDDINKVFRAIVNCAGYNVSDVMKKSRSPEYFEKRMIISYILNKKYQFSTIKIGEVLGLHRGAVQNQIDKMEELIFMPTINRELHNHYLKTLEALGK